MGSAEEAAEVSGSAELEGAADEDADDVAAEDDEEDDADDVAAEVSEDVFLSLVSVIPRRVALAFISSSESEGL